MLLPAGDTLKNWSATLEKNDMEAADPFALPMKKSLKNYWLHFNTWSMDGLPGFKQVASRANKGLIEGVRAPDRGDERSSGNEGNSRQSDRRRDALSWVE